MSDFARPAGQTRVEWTRIPYRKGASERVNSDSQSEQTFLEALRRLDGQALARAYDLHSDEIYRYAARLLGDGDLAEECVAETFSRLLQALRDGRGPHEHLRAYLYRVAHNWITDQYRRVPPAPLEIREDLPDAADGPEEQARVRARQAQVRAALGKLTKDQQQVIALKYLEGWDNEEIARALGKPVGAVKSLQHRALARLRRMLESEEAP